MKSIFTILQDIEKLIYKVLMWVILIPKTIVKITINPGWAPKYVRDELQHDESPFDEYMSPVILLLVVALIPALAFYFRPTFGASISSPAEENPTTDRFLTFTSQTDFRSAFPEAGYVHIWTVEKINEDGSYIEIHREEHFPGGEINYLEQVDDDTVKERFLYTFNDPGSYYVNVFAAKFDLKRDDLPLVESHNAFLTVIVPLRTDEQIKILNTSVKASSSTSASGLDTFAAQVQKERTIFIALALMLPPLLFAFVSKVFMGEAIGENTLKENFYIQCYYFAPPSLAIWATYYAIYFYTNDVYFYSNEYSALLMLLLPPLLAGLWFFRTEVKIIAQERKTTHLKAALIVIACLAVLGYAASIVFSFSTYRDDIRLFAIRIYPLASAALILAFMVAWFRRRRAEGKFITVGNVALFAVYALAFVGILNLIVFFVKVTPPLAVSEQPHVAATSSSTPTPLPAILTTSTPVAEVQPTAPLVLATPTLELQPYYVEEFNSEAAITDWTRFMTSGDERMVKMNVGLGKLSINLLQLEDKLPWFYLINDAFTYSDVRVEAVVTNRGVNANGVSLICRYSDIGWYEFTVSNSGYYSVYVVDNAGIVNRGYNEIFTGGSSEINTGFSTNVYAIVCQGNELRLFINGTLVRTLTDTKFKLAEGKIGLAVTSPRKLPVNVEIETLTVDQP
ncbi:MAG TPA: hypothetical protein VNK49_14140 [Anaerolineales bacterium]|nr:hypothetical protein [Anaerolineales bacterium]